MKQSTEQRILEAAKVVFTKKGFAGARMQEIADEAGINKGLLHYYFRNKQKLFDAIFMDLFPQFAGEINKVLDSDSPLFEKIESFVEEYISFLIENPIMPSFIINELNQHPDEFVKKVLKQQKRPNPMKFLSQINAEVEAGNIRLIQPMHLIVNMVSMCVFPFIAKPMFQRIMGVKDKDYWELMELRKQEVKDFIIFSIKKK